MSDFFSDFEIFLSLPATVFPRIQAVCENISSGQDSAIEEHAEQQGISTEKFICATKVVLHIIKTTEGNPEKLENLLNTFVEESHLPSERMPSLQEELNIIASSLVDVSSNPMDLLIPDFKSKFLELQKAGEFSTSAIIGILANPDHYEKIAVDASKEGNEVLAGVATSIAQYMYLMRDRNHLETFNSRFDDLLSKLSLENIENSNYDDDFKQLAMLARGGMCMFAAFASSSRTEELLLEAIRSFNKGPEVIQLASANLYWMLSQLSMLSPTKAKEYKRLAYESLETALADAMFFPQPEFVWVWVFSARLSKAAWKSAEGKHEEALETATAAKQFLEKALPRFSAMLQKMIKEMEDDLADFPKDDPDFMMLSEMIELQKAQERTIPKMLFGISEVIIEKERATIAGFEEDYQLAAESYRRIAKIESNLREVFHEVFKFLKDAFPVANALPAAPTLSDAKEHYFSALAFLEEGDDAASARRRTTARNRYTKAQDEFNEASSLLNNHIESIEQTNRSPSTEILRWVGIVERRNSLTSTRLLALEADKSIQDGKRSDAANLFAEAGDILQHLAEQSSDDPQEETLYTAEAQHYSALALLEKPGALRDQEIFNNGIERLSEASLKYAEVGNKWQLNSQAEMYVFRGRRFLGLAENEPFNATHYTTLAQEAFAEASTIFKQAGMNHKASLLRQKAEDLHVELNMQVQMLPKPATGYPLKDSGIEQNIQRVSNLNPDSTSLVTIHMGGPKAMSTSQSEQNNIAANNAGVINTGDSATISAGSIAINQIESETDIEAAFSALKTVLLKEKLGVSESEIGETLKNLSTELCAPEPDLTKILKTKKAISSWGAKAQTAISALMRNPVVVKVLEKATDKLFD